MSDHSMSEPDINASLVMCSRAFPADPKGGRGCWTSDGQTVLHYKLCNKKQIKAGAAGKALLCINYMNYIYRSTLLDCELVTH